MRYGFTTGSCAAAASKAATYMLLSGQPKEDISIITPKGIEYKTEIQDITMTDREVKCAVIKDSGDDPDITNGIKIFASVSVSDEEGDHVIIKGGEGVGTVTAPGLDRPVGSPAINSVPLSMIEAEVNLVKKLFDYQGCLEVTISVPEGVEIAKKTYNERLGIIGGISIIGTSGIVEPMSNQALKDTIKLQIGQQVTLGHKALIISPGNYGMDFIREKFDYDLERAVKCSNFIGFTLDTAGEAGVERLLLVGHIGKLIKLSGGIMNTHSAEADCRMELMAAVFLEVGGSCETALKILKCLNTTEAYCLVKKEGKDEVFGRRLAERCKYHLDKRAVDEMQVECIIFSNEDGVIGATEGAFELMEDIKHE